MIRGVPLPAPAVRRSRRVDLGIAQQKLAEELGVSVPTLWSWENGRSEPRGENRIRYAEVLDDMRQQLAAGDAR